MLKASVIISSAFEPKTIGKALKAILSQDSDQILEILVISPDPETAKIVDDYQKVYKKIVFLKDEGKGKPAALNLAFQKAKGEILVFTDGDVFLEENALSRLLEPLNNPQAGGVCGRPMSLNNRKTILGFWSHFLTDSAHRIRLLRSQKDQFIELSGYLLAIRRELVAPIPTQTLADDSFLSHQVAKANLLTKYSPEAKVLVKYPTTISDWFKQKRRSAFEYWKSSYSSGQNMRSPLKEALLGLGYALNYPENFKEFFWLILLFSARIILWFQIIILSLCFSSSRKLWVRINSTK